MNPANTQPKRENLLVVVALAALLLTTLWSYNRMNEAHARATEDGNAWAQSQSLATRIRTLRDQPTLADDHAMQKEDMTRRIADAVAASSMDERRLIAIEHQAARRIGRTAYLEAPTRLAFRDVTLPRVLTMLDALTMNDSRLQVSYLRLAAPRREADPSRWTVDVTVTYLIYEPPMQQN
jgi:hypothetical protein